MSMHALRLTGTRDAPRWLRGEGAAMRANAQAAQGPDDPNRYVLWAMEASLHLHTALPRIADADASDHARAAVVALDDMIKALRHRSLPDAG